MKDCDVSVVIPYYNAKNTLERAIKSLQLQTVLPKEIIIINDNGNSKDDEFLSELQNKYIGLNIILSKNHENRGAAFSRNFGWNIARSKYIAFLDSDDSWEKEKLEHQYKFMESSSAVLSGHKLNISRNYNELISFKKVSFKRLLINNLFPTPTVMIKRDINERFDNKKRYVDDHLLWLEIAHKYIDKVFLINKPLANVHKAMYGENGLSSHLLKMEQGELDVYFQLYRKKYINVAVFLGLLIFSLLKFFRRVLIIYSKKIISWRLH